MAAHIRTSFDGSLHVRQQLERLVQDSVNSGVAPTLASIKALLPLSLRSTEVKKVSVARGDERQVPT